MLDPAPTLALLVSPAILFFVLGLVAALARSDLTVPEPVSKALSLYLMLCIGFKGGVEAREAGLSVAFLMAAGLGVALSALLPFLAWPWLRRLTSLDPATAGALAAAYGSVSVVTFAAAQEHLGLLGLPTSGFMAAVLALMEAPAILTALVLIHSRNGGAPPWPTVAHHAVFGAAGVMLLGSFGVGVISGDAGMARLELFVGPLFQGLLCLFLLDLGLEAARGLRRGGRRLSPAVLMFSVGFPISAGLSTLVAATGLGLQPGDATLLAVLAGSASYIAVPAAMRLAAPQADAGVYVTAPLAITFPLNLLIGIPAYAAVAAALNQVQGG